MKGKIKVDLATAGLPELLDILSKENATRRSNRLALNWLLGVGGGILALLMLASWLRDGKTPDFGSLVPLIALLGAGAAFTSVHKQALKRISEIQTKESAGYLLEAYLTSEERDIREVCLAALPGALASVEESSDLDPYQRGLLYKLLSTKQPKQLVAAALQCSEQIAGPEAIDALEKFRLAASKHKDATWQRLGNHALEVLPTIRMRTAREIIESRVRSTQERYDVEVDRLDLHH